MEWRKDPVLREMEERANIRTRWLAALTVALIGLGFYAAGAHHRINRVVAALAVVADRPTVSTAALADAEWREVNRRLDALERPTSIVTSSTPMGTTISLIYDPAYFSIDAKNRLTLKSSPRSEPCTMVGCLVDHSGSWTTAMPGRIYWNPTGRIRLNGTTITTISGARAVKQ